MLVKNLWIKNEYTSNYKNLTHWTNHQKTDQLATMLDQ